MIIYFVHIVDFNRFASTLYQLIASIGFPAEFRFNLDIRVTGNHNDFSKEQCTVKRVLLRNESKLFAFGLLYLICKQKDLFIY